MQKVKKEASDRGGANFGWLNANYSFSFGPYINYDNMQFGALRVLNDDFIDAGGGFPKHDHKDMEIITIPLQGKLAHEDSTGNSGIIEAGEVQVMSAGTGIFHSEKNASDETLNLFQIWIFTDKNGHQPRYDQRKFEPLRNKWQCLVAPMEKAEGRKALGIHQNAYIHRLNLDNGQSATYNLKDSGNGIFLMLIEGEVDIDGEQLQKRDSLEVTDTSDFTIMAKKESQLICIEVPMI